MVRPGDVLFSKLNPRISRVWVVPAMAGRRQISSTEFWPLRFDRKALDANYLRYFLQNPSTQARVAPVTEAATKSRSRAKPYVLLDVELPLPIPSEQRRIVEILDQADAIRKKRTEADKMAERILPALFYDMFGDPATNPKDWKKEKLGNLLRVKSGEFLPASGMSSGGEIPVYGGNGINGYHDRFMFEEPQVIIGRVGVYCGVVHYIEGRCWVTDNALYVSEMNDQLDRFYLAYSLTVADLNKYAGRAGQPLVSGSRIYPVEILVPPKLLQERFSETAFEIRHVVDCDKQTEVRLDTLQATLLHRAFSGELTAKWREKNKTLVESEMAEQKKILNMTKER